MLLGIISKVQTDFRENDWYVPFFLLSFVLTDLISYAQVIHNPGTPPDYEFTGPGVDVIVTCEEPYETYKGDEVQRRLKD